MNVLNNGNKYYGGKNGISEIAFTDDGNILCRIERLKEDKRKKRWTDR